MLQKVALAKITNEWLRTLSCIVAAHTPFLSIED